MPLLHRNRRIEFPPGSFAAATWTVPKHYGGMTAALLRRSRMFVEQAGIEVPILTLDPGLDVPATRAHLAARGELVPGLTLRNIWEDFRNLPDDALGVRDGAQPEQRPRAESPGEFVRTVSDDEGNAREILHFRADGTLAAADRRSLTGRRVTLYASDGREGRHWGSVWAAYRYWIGSVLAERPAYVVVDSKSIVTFFANLKLKQVRSVHVVHGAHLVPGATDAHGQLTASRRVMVENFDRLDAVVFLTEAQRRDVLARVGERPHAFVIPNSTELPGARIKRDRDVLAGAVLAGLSTRKRVPQAIKGVRLAARTTGLPIRLDVYGDGPDRRRVEAAASRAPGVTLHGHVAGAASRLEDASFLLLTSRSEGLPLVFAEAMSRGCIPIAYDIRYGPADIITDGVDGFLVPDADTEALARAIERLVTLDPAEVWRMRLAARDAAKRYSDAAVAGRWAELFWQLAGSDGSPRRSPRGILATTRQAAGVLPRAVQGLRRAL